MPTIYATAPRDEAAEIAKTLVEAKLAACVNQVQCQSVYRWDGEVHDDPETVLIAKTSEKQVDQAVGKLEAIHPYDVPCIEVFDEADSIESCATWIADATGAGGE